VKLARIRNTKDAYFLSNMEDRSKDKHIHKNSVVEHVCNSRTTLRNFEEREKGKENDRASVICHKM
jgi:hypothetical protein